MRRGHPWEERLPRRNAKGRKKKTQKDVYSHGHRRTDAERESSIYAKWRVAGLVWGLARLTQIPAGSQRSGGFSRRFRRDASSGRRLKPPLRPPMARTGRGGQRKILRAQCGLYRRFPCPINRAVPRFPFLRILRFFVAIVFSFFDRRAGRRSGINASNDQTDQYIGRVSLQQETPCRFTTGPGWGRDLSPLPSRMDFCDVVGVESWGPASTLLRVGRTDRGWAGP